MHIQWFPGHMHKASKDVKAILPQVDVIIEILDARIPFSSDNPMIARLRGDKPCIKLLNKCDLADAQRTAAWQDFLEQERGVKTLAVSVKQAEKIKQLPELCKKLVPEKAASHKLITALIMGIPNVGKSSTINLLAGRMVAKTGNEPAITKGQQRIDIGNNVILMDTPGLLWANLENPATGYRLAVTGAIRDTAIDHHDVAHFALETLMMQYAELLKQRFQLTELPEKAEDLLALIGKQRGCLMSGGKIDMDKTAKIVLTEFRTGNLGGITLETPEMMQQELAQLELIHAEKEAKKLARKQKGVSRSA